jgi:O-antigen ligase
VSDPSALLEEKGALGAPQSWSELDLEARALRSKSEAKVGASAGARIASFASAVLLATVALVPLPFGSASPSTMAFWSIILGAGLVFAAPLARERHQNVLLGLVAVVVAAYAFVLHEQLVAHPWVAAPNPLWKTTSEALHMELEPSASIARHAAFFAIGSPLLCVLALACGFLIASDRERAMTLLKVIAWSGVAYAVYGIVSHIVDPTKVLWRDKPAYFGSVTGTFINRNTAAAYFGSCSVLCFLLLCQRLRRHLPSGPIEWRKLPGRVLADTPRDIVIRFAMFFLCLAAMFMTGSRAGVLVSLIALIVAFALYFWHDLPRRGRLVSVLLSGGAGALILLELMGAGVSARFDTEGLGDGGRLATYRATLRLIADHPWFGTGQGTFAWAYPAYRSSEVSMWGVWDRAHDTLLEIAADMGIPIAALVVIAWLVIFAILVHGVRNRRRNRIFPVAGLSVGILAVLHSLVDFSLQIPGYSIVALAVVGAGVARSFAPRERRPGHPHGTLSFASKRAKSLGTSDAWSSRARVNPNARSADSNS